MPQHRDGEGKIALSALAMAVVLAALGTSVANVALPALGRAFGASFDATRWIVVVYLAAMTMAIIGAGRLGDLLGRRRLLIVGIVTFLLASIACAMSAGLAMLIVARAVQGAGAAMMMALAMAMVGDVVPVARTSTAMGVLSTMSAAGTALGPSVGGVLLDAFGWRSLFVSIGALAVVTLAIAARTLPRDDGEKSKRAHDAGAAVSTSILALLRDRVLGARLLSNALVTTVVMATLVVGPFYLGTSLDLDATRMGLVMSVGPLVAAAVGVPAGRAADRFGARATSLLGLAVSIVGSMLLALSSPASGVVGYVAPMGLLTGGYALFQTSNNAAVMAAARANARGAVSGLLNFSRNVGLIAGASLMGTVYTLGTTRAAADASPSVVTATGLHVTFAVASLLVLLALALNAADTTRTVRAQRTNHP